MYENRLRASTIKKTLASEESRRQKEEIRKEKRTSAQYSKLVKKEIESYAVSALDLAKTASDLYGVDSSSSVAEGNSIQEEGESIYGSPRSSAEQEELVWDPSADVDSPEKFEQTLIFPDLSPGGSETWSTGANLFPINCASTPNYEEDSQRYIFDTQLSIPYSPGALGEILEEPESLFVPKEIVCGLVDSTLESSFNASSFIFPANMEEERLIRN